MFHTKNSEAMNAILIMVVMTFISLSTKAQMEKFNNVITKTDTIFCKNIKVGVSNTRCIHANGEKIKIANRDILRYSLDGRLIQRLPVYLNNKKSKRTDMMELVEFRNGVGVYKDEDFNGTGDRLDAIFYFYVRGECVKTQKNPQLFEIYEFLGTYEKPNKEPDQSKQLVNR